MSPQRPARRNSGAVIAPDRHENTRISFHCYSDPDLCYATMRELHREIKKDQKDQRWAFWLFVLMAGIVAVVGGFLGNFLREAAVRALDALGAWWGS